MNAQKGTEEIHVMPKSEKGGVTKPAVSRAPLPPVKTAGATEPDGGRSWTKVVLVIFILALIAASAYFLYSAYAPSSSENQSTDQQSNQNSNQTPATSETTDNNQTTPNQPEQPTATDDATPTSVPGSKNDFEFGTVKELNLDMASSKDTDKDKLTDVEESLFGTSIENFDSDGDTFGDGEEVIHLYDPKKGDGAKLYDSASVRSYVNDNYQYAVLYPAAWLAKSTDKSDSEVVFTSANNEFVSVWVEENTQRLELKDWYVKQAPNIAPDDMLEFRNQKGLTGLKSPDGYTMYFANNGLIYILHYNIGLKSAADYPGVFKMMIESFDFIRNEQG
ncbi:MAG: hypothetical protein ACOZBH_01500 [Patescibacteria group bacterium]